MTTPQVFRRSPRAKTVRAARTENVATAIGPLEPGHPDLFVLTHGQFSLIDALVYLSTQTGPARLSITTWTAGTADLQHMADLLGSGAFSSMRWLVDRSFITRQPAYCARLRQLFGDDIIRTARLHAKFATLRNERFNLAVRTSMNLNHNPRMEYLEVSDDGALADFLDAEIDAYFRTQAPGLFDCELMEEAKAGQASGGKASGNRLYRS